MPRIERFTFVVNSSERKLIRDLANYLHCSESSAARFVIVSAAKNLIPQNGQNFEINNFQKNIPEDINNG